MALFKREEKDICDSHVKYSRHGKCSEEGKNVVC